VPRPPRPDDLYRLRVPIGVRLSPDGGSVVTSVKTVAPGFDGYRHALWIVPTDGGEPRQLTIGAKNDWHARWSPDGRTLAFLSDRRSVVEEEPARSSIKTREDVVQVYLLPVDGGEARRLTDLPRGVTGLEWSPDGTRLVVISTSFAADFKEDRKKRGLQRPSEPGSPPESDYRFVDRLDYMLNGEGFTYDRVGHLWLVDVASGEATKLTDGPTAEHSAAWSPDGSRIAFSANRHRDADLVFRSDLFTIDVETGGLTAITAGPKSFFDLPTWLPDGRTLAALGHRFPAGAGSRNDIWLFAADGSDARPDGGRNLSGEHDLMPASGMNSDVTIGDATRVIPSSDGAWLTFTAPMQGAYELFRIAVADGRLERITDDPHYISGWDGIPGAQIEGRLRIAYLRSTPTEPPDLYWMDGRSHPRRLTEFNKEALADIDLTPAQERHVTVDGRDIQGWFIPGGDASQPRPLVLEIHGGPHTLYGWSPIWEFQVLAGSGIGVFYSNPRGSEGYGEAFNYANFRDWGPGPTRDVLAGVESLVADGLADPDRLGVTGGSYGGYLTNWIVAHDHRFRTAMTCRCVADMGMLFMTGDISGGEWAKLEFDAYPWDDPSYFREISPVTYAGRIKTPLLIQHSEHDIRTTIGQAESQFTVMRSLKKPVRLLRVPEETHELTRSGTPFRRVENLEIVLAWFKHFLVDGKRGLPPLPKVRAGR
jgi:dipeptidyl aminopeptidase/acylaminoacyl peptidase